MKNSEIETDGYFFSEDTLRAKVNSDTLCEKIYTIMAVLEADYVDMQAKQVANLKLIEMLHALKSD